MKKIMIGILWLAVLGGIGYVVLAVPLGSRTMMERAAEVMDPKKQVVPTPGGKAKAEHSSSTAHKTAQNPRLVPAKKPTDANQLTDKDRQKLDQLIHSKLKVEKDRG